MQVLAHGVPLNAFGFRYKTMIKKPSKGMAPVFSISDNRISLLKSYDMRASSLVIPFTSRSDLAFSFPPRAPISRDSTPAVDIYVLMSIIRHGGRVHTRNHTKGQAAHSPEGRQHLGQQGEVLKFNPRRRRAPASKCAFTACASVMMFDWTFGKYLG